MPRGGARPGAGRPRKSLAEHRRERTKPSYAKPPDLDPAIFTLRRQSLIEERGRAAQVCRPQGELARIDGPLAAYVYDVLPRHVDVHRLRAARRHIDRSGTGDRFPVDQHIGNDAMQVRAAVVVEHDVDRHLMLVSCEAFAHAHRQARLRLLFPPCLSRA
jgi:hypothetical protein